MINKKKPVIYSAFFAGLITLLVYLPALKCGFIIIDDPVYVLNNQLIKELDLGRVISMFTRSHEGWWMPLTWLSLAIDYRFWGVNPFGYHLTNILLHAVNVALVVLIAGRMVQGRRAVRIEEGAVTTGYHYPVMLLLAGLLFGIHPLRVESVAWVSERKDVLNGLFSFSSILCYLLFVEHKDGSSEKKTAVLCYALSLLCFVMSLMAKSVSVVLPLMLLSLDWSPLGRISRDTIRPILLEKAPFFIASALMTFFTIFFAARSQYLVTYEAFPLVQRVAVSGNAVWEYCRMLLFPAGLSPFNVIPDPVPLAYQVRAGLVALALVALFLARIPASLKSCLLCFLLPLLPVLAFFQNGDQAFADRFTYLPSLSLAVFMGLFLHGVTGSAGKSSGKRLILSAAALCTLLFIVVTVRQIAVWRTTETYWNRIIEIEPLAISYKERGLYYHLTGRYDAAVGDFTSAINRVAPTLKPYEYNLYAFRAESLRAAGRFAEAVRDFNTAIGLHPYPAYYYHRGLALKAMGKTLDAEEDFRRAGPDAGPILWFD